jgi:mono/diheme cytochrome c family protein
VIVKTYTLASRSLAVLPIAFVMSVSSASAQLPQRCAACHLRDGAGVPGSFPSLRGPSIALAAKPEGRRYLVLAVTRGLSGPLRSGGQAFRGVMPGNAGMSDADVASALNAVLATAPPTIRRFTPAEVGTLRQSGQKLTPADVARLRASLE